MANDDFFDGLDAAEAAHGQKILETKNEKRVRYWYEEGYIPGNEKDSDEEDNNDGNAEAEEVEAESDADSSASSTKYEEVKTACGGKHGGRRVRWGGIHGKLALTDGDASTTTLAKFEEVMDELLLPGGDSGARSSAGTEVDEVAAVVMSQVPQEGRCWSYTYSSNLAVEDGRLEEEYEATRERFAIEDGSENLQVRSEEAQAMAQWAKAQDAARRQARADFVREFRKEEAKKRSIERGAREQLPGTRRPLPLSQAWQERRAETSGQAPKAPKPSGRSMLPCSLSGGASSSKDGGKALRSEARLPVGQSESMTLRRSPMAQMMRESVLKAPSAPEPEEDDGMQPLFRVPPKPVPIFQQRK